MSAETHLVVVVVGGWGGVTGDVCRRQSLGRFRLFQQQQQRGTNCRLEFIRLVAR